MHYKSSIIAVTLTALLAAGTAFAQSEGSFFTDTSGQGITKTLSPGSGTAAVQNAINTVANNSKGGKVVLQKGTYNLGKINLKSKVHIFVKKGSVIKPTGTQLFVGALSGSQIKDISIRGDGGRFVVDMSGKARLSDCSPILLGNVKNFMIANINFKDNYTKFSCIRTTRGAGSSFPTDGVIKNCTLTTKGHVGYGTLQTGAGRHILVKNLNGIGGVTMRCETGSGGLKGLNGSLFDIYGRTIKCKNGNAAVMISPHAMNNGKIDVSGVTGTSCASAVRIDRADTRNGTTPGKFSSVRVANVSASYGTKAMIKNGRQHWVPCSKRHLIGAKTPSGLAWWGPSSCAIINTAKNTPTGAYNSNISGVSQTGFPAGTKKIQDWNNDRIKNCP